MSELRSSLLAVLGLFACGALLFCTCRSQSTSGPPAFKSSARPDSPVHVREQLVTGRELVDHVQPMVDQAASSDSKREAGKQAVGFSPAVLTPEELDSAISKSESDSEDVRWSAASQLAAHV